MLGKRIENALLPSTNLLPPHLYACLPLLLIVLRYRVEPVKVLMAGHLQYRIDCLSPEVEVGVGAEGGEREEATEKDEGLGERKGTVRVGVVKIEPEGEWVAMSEGQDKRRKG